ncbi:hypothetical protein MMG85_02155 [Pseudoxanthomonas sp. LH2527]|uniref:hypothetical protein n=1 Tax=Pseudoxanthomonas sp. LH2527 TaxID=2923249 RepID=UPI001F13EB15|nr:hypothetical protein [Pseudoxanthomonas sp. LH2527]MCH6482374.1 hypothetical protein [Pseudoxanthomonas sp. LH2527]
MNIGFSSTAARRSTLALTIAAAALAAACTQNAAPTASTPESAPTPVTEPASSEPVQQVAAASQFGPALPQDLQGPVQSGGECGIEATAEVPQGAELSLSRSVPQLIEGWALDRADKTAPTSVYLKLESGGDASYFVPVAMGTRAGLGIRLGEASLDSAAFSVNAALAEVPAGQYNVQVAQRIGDKILLCATGRSAKVAE